MKVKLRDGGTRNFKYVYVDSDRHGKTRVYFWRGAGHSRIRLRQDPGSEEFDNEYARALGSTPRPVKSELTIARDTLRWLCQQYFLSAVFQNTLGPTTRKVRRSILEHICQMRGVNDDQRIGSLPYATMEPRNIAQLRDAKAKYPEAANSRVRALRALFRWACSLEVHLAESNPARDVALLPSNNPDGFKPWTEADVAKYEGRHPLGTNARLALDLLLYTGVRRSDVVKLGSFMERDGLLVFTETKGRARKPKHHELPILPALRESIDATPRQIVPNMRDAPYLLTQFGRAHSEKAFGNWFKRRCREAGVDAEVSAHGLRKLAASRFAELGATEQQLMAWFGWVSPKQPALYTKNANRAKLEQAAAALVTRRL
jgi:integrase